QGSLQPLLNSMVQSQLDLSQQIFGTNYPELLQVLRSPLEDQLGWARSIQDRRFRIAEPWRGQFKALGRTPQFQQIERQFSDRLHQDALALCRQYELWSQRAVALMFDIRVQNGSISPLTQAQIERDFAQVASSAESSMAEAERL